MAAFVVMVRSRMRDETAFAEYARLAPQVQCKEFPEILAFYGAHEDLEGMGADGVVILRFSSMEAARSWYESGDYQKAAQNRWRGADYNVWIVEGVGSDFAL